MKIVINDKILTDDEVLFIRDLLSIAKDFQIETFNMAKDIALNETPEAINDSLSELLNGDEDERELIMDIINDKYKELLDLVL